MKGRLSLWFIILFLLQINVCQTQTVDRVEPPFWWTNMNTPELPLMIYGENIASLEPEINYKGLKIKNVSSLDNPVSPGNSLSVQLGRQKAERAYLSSMNGDVIPIDFQNDIDNVILNIPGLLSEGMYFLSIVTTTKRLISAKLAVLN